MVTPADTDRSEIERRGPVTTLTMKSPPQTGNATAGPNDINSERNINVVEPGQTLSSPLPDSPPLHSSSLTTRSRNFEVPDKDGETVEISRRRRPPIF